MLVEVGRLVADIAAVQALPPLFTILTHSLTHAELNNRVEPYKENSIRH